MNTKNLTRSLMAACAIGVSFVSCSDDENFWNEVNGPNPEKEAIALTGSNGEEVTRAYFADTRAALDPDNKTKIVMRIKSEDTETTSGHTTGSPRYTRTIVTASAKKEASDNDVHSKLGEEHSDITFSDGNYRYWDDAYGRYGKLSIYAVAVPGKDDNSILSDDILTDASSTSKVSDANPKWFTEATENEKLTWTLPINEQTAETNANKDLCYSNNISTNGKKGVYKYKWTSSNQWEIDALTDGNMIWRSNGVSGSTAGKFDQGNLVFRHALCKVTINLTEGKGFNNEATTDFSFKSGTNVELLDFPYQSQLDLATGTWSAASGTLLNGTIKKLQETTATSIAAKTVRTVVGLTLPDKVLKGQNTNALHFVIDDNDYYVTCDQIATAIRSYYAEKLSDGTTANPNYNATLAAFEKMQQGQHYVINITVGKTKIDNITAQLIAWEEVNSAEIDPSNAYVSFNVEERSTNTTTLDNDDAAKFDLYRKESKKSALSNSYTSYINDYNDFIDYEWTTGYVAGSTAAATDKATKTWDETNSRWKTEWYWPDNLTYYHFRAVGSTQGSTPTITKDATNGDYYPIKSDKLEAEGTTYKDYIWGAPCTDIDATAKFEYSINDGFNIQTKDTEGKVTSSQIYKAIGATHSKINLMMFHMTAQVFFEVKTTTGEDKVTLRTGAGSTESPYKQTKVELLRFYKDGTVLVGTGKVEPSTTGTGALTTEQELEFKSFTAESGTTAAVSKSQYGVIPQTLNRESDSNTGNEYKVGLRITTPDNNQYIIQDISTVYASTVSTNNLKNPYTVGTGTNASKYLINRWYPGYQYTYTVTLKKTGIASITAQLVDWETVTGDLGTIDLEGTN